MYGRNGTDQFSLFLMLCACVSFVLSLLVSGLIGVVGTAFYVLALGLFFYAYFRAFSRNLAKRRRENAWYLRKKAAFLSRFRAGKEQFRQRRDYCFFTCPSCKARLRVPRHKGRIRIVCRKCGQAFEKRT